MLDSDGLVVASDCFFRALDVDVRSDHHLETSKSHHCSSFERPNARVLYYGIPHSRMMLGILPESERRISVSDFYELISQAHFSLDAIAIRHGGLDEPIVDSFVYPEYQHHYEWRLEVTADAHAEMIDWPTYRDVDNTLTGLHNVMAYLGYYYCYFQLFRLNRQGCRAQHDFAWRSVYPHSQNKVSNTTVLENSNLAR